MYHILFIHSSTDGHLDCSHLSATVNNTAMNIHIQVFVCTHIFNLVGDIPRSGIAESHGNSIFNLLKSCQTILQNSYTILQSHQKYMRILISLHPHQHLLSSVFFILAILVRMKWYLIIFPNDQ